MISIVENTEHETLSTHQFGNFTFQQIRETNNKLGSVQIIYQDKVIGTFHFQHAQGNEVCGHLIMRGDYRGQGIGINLYRILLKITAEMGLKLVPSKMISDRARAIWQQINPQSLEGYERSSKPFDERHGHLWSRDPRMFPPTIR